MSHQSKARKVEETAEQEMPDFQKVEEVQTKIQDLDEVSSVKLGCWLRLFIPGVLLSSLLSKCRGRQRAMRSSHKALAVLLGSCVDDSFL